MSQTHSKIKQLNVTNLTTNQRHKLFIDHMNKNGFTGFIKQTQNNQTIYTSSHTKTKKGENMKTQNKKATLTVELVPESQPINNERIKKEITKTLTCDWLLKVKNIEIEF